MIFRKKKQTDKKPVKISLRDKYRFNESIIAYTLTALIGAATLGYQTLGPSLREGLRVVEEYRQAGENAGFFNRALGRLGMGLGLTDKDAEQAIVLYDRLGDGSILGEGEFYLGVLEGSSLGMILFGLAGEEITRRTKRRRLNGQTAQNSLAVNIGERFLLRTNKDEENLFRKAA